MVGCSEEEDTEKKLERTDMQLEGGEDMLIVGRGKDAKVSSS